MSVESQAAKMASAAFPGVMVCILVNVVLLTLQSMTNYWMSLGEKTVHLLLLLLFYQYTQHIIQIIYNNPTELLLLSWYPDNSKPQT